MIEWGSKLSLGTNYFIDPTGNAFYMDFKEKLIRNKLFRISADFKDLYDLDDVHYICTLFCGDRYFRVRIFNLGWDEIRYPGLASAVVAEENLVWSRFLSLVRVKLSPAKVSFSKCFDEIFLFHVFVIYECNSKCLCQTVMYQTGCVFLHFLGEEDCKW